MYLVKRVGTQLEKGTVPPKPCFHALFGEWCFYRIKLKICIVMLLYFIPKHYICYQDSNDDIVSFLLFRNNIVASDIWMQSW